MVKKVYYSNNELRDDVLDLIRQVEADFGRPTLVGGFARGGLLPAVMMSHYWNIPMIPLRFSTRDFAHDYLDSLRDEVKEHKFLVVDDIVDSGETFNIFKKKMEGLNWKSSALIYNLGQDVYDVDYYAREVNKVEENIWIVFEYENFWTPTKFNGFPYK